MKVRKDVEVVVKDGIFYVVRPTAACWIAARPSRGSR